MSAVEKFRLIIENLNERISALNEKVKKENKSVVNVIKHVNINNYL